MYLSFFVQSAPSNARKHRFSCWYLPQSNTWFISLINWLCWNAVWTLCAFLFCTRYSYIYQFYSSIDFTMLKFCSSFLIMLFSVNATLFLLSPLCWHFFQLFQLLQFYLFLIASWPSPAAVNRTSSIILYTYTKCIKLIEKVCI